MLADRDEARVWHWWARQLKIFQILHFDSFNFNFCPCLLSVCKFNYILEENS